MMGNRSMMVTTTMALTWAALGVTPGAALVVAAPLVGDAYTKLSSTNNFGTKDQCCRARRYG